MRGSAGPDETPSAFLERLMEAFCQYPPYDPGAEEHRATLTVEFIAQAMKDMKRKLQTLDSLQEESLGELVQTAEKAYHKRETRKGREETEVEEGELRRGYCQGRKLEKILTAVRIGGDPSLHK